MQMLIFAGFQSACPDALFFYSETITKAEYPGCLKAMKLGIVKIVILMPFIEVGTVMICKVHFGCHAGGSANLSEHCFLVDFGSISMGAHFLNAARRFINRIRIGGWVIGNGRTQIADQTAASIGLLIVVKQLGPQR